MSSKWKLVRVTRSDRPGKKWKAVFQNVSKSAMTKTRTRHFGAEGMEDYTMHKDEERRRRYRQRHKKDLTGDYTSPGYLSYYVLWGPTTSFDENLRLYKQRFGL